MNGACSTSRRCQLGEALADLLLPDSLRDLFTRSLDRLQPEKGLRLRLHLPSDLTDIPWEYMYIPRVGDTKECDKDVTGFLGLDPRIGIGNSTRSPAQLTDDASDVPATSPIDIATIICHQCGTGNQAEDNFCSKCGLK